MKSLRLRLSAALGAVLGWVDGVEVQMCIRDRDVTHLEPKDRNVAMVFQNYALYPTMSVYDNIAFALTAVKIQGGEEKPRHYTKKEIDVKVREVAGQLDLTRLLKRKPRELSGGEKQRVALALSLIHISLDSGGRGPAFHHGGPQGLRK